MAAQRRRCRKCRVQFSRPMGSRRLDCEKCSPPRVRSTPAEPVAEVAELAPERARGDLETTTLVELAAVGRAETTAGALALYLARQLDAGGHTGSQTAALAARLLEARAQAVAGATPTDDAVDELRRRREWRATAG